MPPSPRATSARHPASANSTAPSWPGEGHGPAADLHAAARGPADPARPGRAISAANAHPAGAVLPELDLRQRRIAAESSRRADGGDHVQDAAARAIENGQWVRVFNDRGSFQARAVVGDNVKPGVVVSQGICWNKYTPDKVNCNTTTSTRLPISARGRRFSIIWSRWSSWKVQCSVFRGAAQKTDMLRDALPGQTCWQPGLCEKKRGDVQTNRCRPPPARRPLFF